MSFKGIVLDSCCYLKELRSPSIYAIELEDRLNDWFTQQGVFIGDPEERGFKKGITNNSPCSSLILSSSLFLRRKKPCGTLREDSESEDSSPMIGMLSLSKKSDSDLFFEKK